MEPLNESSKRRKSLSRIVFEWLSIAIIAFVLALVVRAFVFQSFYIPSGSMLPTLQIGDRILVDKLSYDLHGIHEGDIVVFRKPASDTNSAGITDLVKRVIGLPGQRIAAINGQVYINGKLLKEPFLPKSALTYNLPSQVVPKGDVFVMGDNRTNSKDSRIFGPISEKLIVGKVVLIFWPISQFKVYF